MPLRRTVLFKCLLVAGLQTTCMAGQALASPEQDRAAFIALYRAKFPDVPLENYVDGALMFSKDAKTQFDSIMEFPPFQGDIDRGRSLWETPFRNGQTFAGCFARGEIGRASCRERVYSSV